MLKCFLCNELCSLWWLSQSYLWIGKAGIGLDLYWFPRRAYFHIPPSWDEEWSSGWSKGDPGPSTPVLSGLILQIQDLPLDLCAAMLAFSSGPRYPSDEGQKCQKQRIWVPCEISSLHLMHTDVPPGLWYIPPCSLLQLGKIQQPMKGGHMEARELKQTWLSHVITCEICLRNSNQMGTGGPKAQEPGLHTFKNLAHGDMRASLEKALFDCSFACLKVPWRLVKGEGGLCQPVKSWERNSVRGKTIRWNQACDGKRSLILSLAEITIHHGLHTKLFNHVLVREDTVFSPRSHCWLRTCETVTGLWGRNFTRGEFLIAEQEAIGLVLISIMASSLLVGTAVVCYPDSEGKPSGCSWCLLVPGEK